MQHLHTEYEQELVPLFVKVLGNVRLSRSKLNEDAVDRVAVLTYKLIPQPPEKCGLFFVESSIDCGFMMVVVPFHHSDTASETTADCFNRV